MPPRNDRRPWIKLFIDECLTGTIREELSTEERCVWYDFLLLAGKNRVRGCISANETQAISPRRVAAILNVKENVISHCVGKFIENGRITVDKAGIIHITNWDNYQYSSYDRSKKYRDGSPKTSPEEPEAELSPDDIPF